MQRKLVLKKLKQVSDSFLDIKDILNEYSDEIQESITEEAINIAKEGAEKLKRTSPKRTGRYAKGWKVKTIKGKGYVSATIYNSTNWQLTHLLENPHVIRNSNGTYGISKPKVHIAPVEEKCIAEFEHNVENIIKNGG